MTESKDTTEYESELQVEIERLPNDDKRGNYRVVAGNPLDETVKFEQFCTQLKINDYAMATSSMQIGEHDKTITIECSETMVNIVLDSSEQNAQLYIVTTTATMVEQISSQEWISGCTWAYAKQRLIDVFGEPADRLWWEFACNPKEAYTAESIAKLVTDGDRKHNENSAEIVEELADAGLIERNEIHTRSGVKAFYRLKATSLPEAIDAYESNNL